MILVISPKFYKTQESEKVYLNNLKGVRMVFLFRFFFCNKYKIQTIKNYAEEVS